MEKLIATVFGTVGAAIAAAFGGWTEALTTLIIFMAADYVTGLVLAGVFHKSKKSENGSIESGACWKGLFKKGANLLLVLIACRLDILAGTNYLRDAIVIAICVCEAISILENVSLMGVPIPKALRKALEVLKENENNQMEEDKDQKTE